MAFPRVIRTLSPRPGTPVVHARENIDDCVRDSMPQLRRGRRAQGRAAGRRNLDHVQPLRRSLASRPGRLSELRKTLRV